MKNKINKIMAIFFSFVLLGCSVFASTNTYERNEANKYGVNSYSVTSSNKDNVMNTPYVDASEKVYDFADLLDESEETELFELIDDFIEEYNMDMVFVTTRDTDFRDWDEYADDFYDYNDFGLNATKDGILFLIDMEHRQLKISTTGEGIRVFSDSRIESILDDIYYYASDADYFGAAKEFVSSSSYYAKKGVAPGNENIYIDPVTRKATRIVKFQPRYIFFGAIGSAIITGIFILIASGMNKTIRKATKAKEYIVKDSFVLHRNEDKFLSTHTSKVYDPPSSSSSSGGGSSFHSSSSGASHGGGSRGF